MAKGQGQGKGIGNQPPPDDSPQEFWWAWERDVPHDLIRAGLTTMIRPKFRGQDYENDPVGCAVNAFNQANSQWQNLVERHQAAGMDEEPLFCLMPQDLGGHHSRPHEFRTLFNTGYDAQHVGENILYWQDVLRRFFSYWHGLTPPRRPRLHSLCCDFEGYGIWAPDDMERERRVREILSPAFLLAYQPFEVNNWLTHGVPWRVANLSGANTVCYRPSENQIDANLARLDDALTDRKSCWIQRATVDRGSRGTWTPALQRYAVDQGREKGYVTWIYWAANDSTDADWKSLLNCITG